jgi:hypothetical protein
MYNSKKSLLKNRFLIYLKNLVIVNTIFKYQPVATSIKLFYSSFVFKFTLLFSEQKLVKFAALLTI